LQGSSAATPALACPPPLLLSSSPAGEWSPSLLRRRRIGREDLRGW
jgi:hypothetical protein